MQVLYHVGNMSGCSRIGPPGIYGMACALILLHPVLPADLVPVRSSSLFRPPPCITILHAPATKTLLPFKQCLHSSFPFCPPPVPPFPSPIVHRGHPRLPLVCMSHLSPWHPLPLVSFAPLASSAPPPLSHPPRSVPLHSPLHCPQGATSLRPFCSPRTAALGHLIEDQLQLLVKGEVQRQLARCGLAEIVDRIRLYQVRTTCHQYPRNDFEILRPILREARTIQFEGHSCQDGLLLRVLRCMDLLERQEQTERNRE